MFENFPNLVIALKEKSYDLILTLSLLFLKAFTKNDNEKDYQKYCCYK